MGSLGPAELIGIVAAIVILLIAFGSVLAMGLPIMVALFGVGIGAAFVELLSHTIDKLSVFRRRRQGVRTSIWYRWSRVVQHRPWPALLAGLIVLAVLAVPLFSIRLGFPDAGANPTSDTTRRAYDLVADGFGAGFNGPLLLAAEFPRGTDPAPV